MSNSTRRAHKGEAAPTPRWPAVLAALSVAGLSAALPASLSFGPRWLTLTIVIVLLVPTVFARRMGREHLNQFFGYGINVAVTLALCASLARLLVALPSHRETPLQLLQSASALWLTNVLVFALWYWRLDAGGPHRRDAQAGHSDGAFLFPQMTMDGQENWSPEFIDYLFLAFTASTALSPTDSPVLSRWAKALMMLQALVSLLVLAFLAARAVNVL